MMDSSTGTSLHDPATQIAPEASQQVVYHACKAAGGEPERQLAPAYAAMAVAAAAAAAAATAALPLDATQANATALVNDCRTRGSSASGAEFGHAGASPQQPSQQQRCPHGNAEGTISNACGDRSGTGSGGGGRLKGEVGCGPAGLTGLGGRQTWDAYVVDPTGQRLWLGR